MPRNTAEQIFKGQLRGPLTTKATSSANQWAGRTSVLSGVATATVSTFLVNSDSLIATQGVSAVASNVAQVIKVTSMSDSNYFGFTITPAPVGTDFQIMWQITRTT